MKDDVGIAGERGGGGIRRWEDEEIGRWGDKKKMRR